MKKNHEKNTTSMTVKNSNTQNSEKMRKEKTDANRADKYFYERKFVNPKELKIHSLLNVLGFDQPDEVFTEQANHFNFLERPVITEDGYVITHPTDVLVAQQLKKAKLETVVMKNATADDVIRFISFKNYRTHGKGRKKLFGMIEFLTNHLTQTESGKEWAGELPGTKTRMKVAGIMGVSEGTVQNIKNLGAKNVQALEKIDEGKLTATAAKKGVFEIPFTSRKKFENLKFTDTVENIKAEPQFKINSMSFDIDQVGKLEYSFDGSKAIGKLNGIELENAFHSVQSDYNNEEKRRDTQHHVIQAINHEYSIQITFRDLKSVANECGTEINIAA